MAYQCIVLAFALFTDVAFSSNNLLRASAKASSKAQFRSRMLASAEANMKIRANMQQLAMKAKKYGLPWANLDADGGEEFEFGNEQDDITDPKLFSVAQYDHTSATDDADVTDDEDSEEGTEDVEDDSFKHGDDSLSHDDDSDDNGSD